MPHPADYSDHDLVIKMPDRLCTIHGVAYNIPGWDCTIHSG